MLPAMLSMLPAMLPMLPAMQPMLPAMQPMPPAMQPMLPAMQPMLPAMQPMLLAMLHKPTGLPAISAYELVGCGATCALGSAGARVRACGFKRPGAWLFGRVLGSTRPGRADFVRFCSILLFLCARARCSISTTPCSTIARARSGRKSWRGRICTGAMARAAGAGRFEFRVEGLDDSSFESRVGRFEFRVEGL